MTPIPIYLVNRGRAEYVTDVLEHLRHSNPDSPIRYVTDHAVGMDGIEDIDITSFMGEADNFAKVYRHLSVNRRDYELFCFQRWFVLRSIITRNRDAGPFMAFDCDVLAFANFTDYFSRRPCKLTATGWMTPAASYFQTVSVLEALCRRICDFYVSKAPSIRENTNLEVYRRTNGPHYSDMNFVGQLMGEFQGTDTAKPWEGTAFDNNLNKAEGFETELGRKVVKFRDGRAFGKLEGGDEIEFLTLHFQGQAKKWLSQFANRSRRSRGAV